MANLTGKVTITYEENRSREFQGARLGASVEVELKEGETIEDAISQWAPTLRDSVTDITYNECERLVQEKRHREAEDPAPDKRRW